MAVVIRTKAGKGSPDRVQAKTPTVKVSLPESPTEPSGSLNDFSVLIHRVKKIGKTSLALQGGRSLLLQFDPPQIAYRRMEILCPDWKTFKAALQQLEARAAEGNFPYDRVVIDRADMWYKHCEYWVMEKLAISKMSEEAFGGAWQMAEREFTEAVDRVLRLPCGKWFLCHSMEEAEENRHGEEIIKLKPNLNKRADAVLNGKCDGWFAYVYEGKRRALVVRGDDRTGAGHRIDGHFLTRTGKRVKAVDMGRSPEEAWKNFLAAFNNKQEEIDPFQSKE
jgi:hypothetical protein